MLFGDFVHLRTSITNMMAIYTLIWHKTTIPEARRQGIGMALTLAPLREAHAMGYRISVLHPSDMGRGVYRRLGFEDYGNLSHGLWVSESQ